MKKDKITSMAREILLRDWDPCGVGGNNALKDEYDEYLPTIVELIVQQSPASALDEALIGFEKELGVALQEQQRKRVVQALLRIRL